jgi:plasmid stabilization system protein ParE
MHCIEDALVLVAQNPQLFQFAYRNLRRAVVRRFPFAIFYQVMSDEILVVAVFHSRRDPEVLRERIR